MRPTPHILIVGCGDIGLRIARHHLARGERVTGLVRREDAAAALLEAGVQALLSDLDSPWQGPAADAIYWCAPPPSQGLDEPRLSAALTTLPPPSRGLLYISTTGVYGDCQGRWIDEAEPLKPQTARGQRRLAAELHLRGWAARTGGRSITLRVPGIYGPGRLPKARLLSGTPIVHPDESPYSNRIHADDLAAAAVLALDQGEAGAAYNVSDGAPSTMADYFLRCATLLGLPPPPLLGMAQARQQLSPALLSFMEESKRIEPLRLRKLGFAPRYPNLSLGLPECL